MRISKVIKCGCGASLSVVVENCPNCTWPFELSGWKKTNIRLRRITIDTGCLNTKRKVPSLNVLETWATEGHIEIQRADALLEELSGQERIEKAQQIPDHPPLTTFPIGLGGGAVLAGPDLGQELTRILFPTTKNLTDKQKKDVRHLQQHARTGGHCFVTINTRDFIRGGKAETLRSEFGVWVFTPDEAVGLLRELYGVSQKVGDKCTRRGKVILTEADMERLKGKETGQPQFDEDEVAMIQQTVLRLKDLITTCFKADVINRDSVFRFCEIATDVIDRLRELARSNPEPLKEYLKTHSEETKIHSARGTQHLTEDHKFWVRHAKRTLKGVVRDYLEVSNLNRETVFKFSEIVGRIADNLRELAASGNPEPLREYLERLPKRE